MTYLTKLITAMLVLFMLIGGIGIARTLTVPEDYKTIQKAIVEANPEDTVMIEAGTYEENLEINKNLTLRGSGEKETEIKSAKKCHTLVFIGPSKVKVEVEDIKLSETRADYCFNPASKRPSSAIYMVGDSTATISDSAIWSQGDGILLHGSSRAILKGITIQKTGWLGINIGNSSQVIVSDSTISGCNDYGGIGLFGSSKATVINTTISNNLNGIWLRSSSQVTLKNSIIRKNEIGIEIYKPEEFEGVLKGTNNIIKDNDRNYKNIPNSIQEELTGTQD